ncbi:MAG: hypothetical protein LBU34_00845 [Planctomycetaceae bacterium]|jgi:hypothetical protein|nr:hypothetical protein [Planctomycetaceae bacterium]
MNYRDHNFTVDEIKKQKRIDRQNFWYQTILSVTTWGIVFSLLLLQSLLLWNQAWKASPTVTEVSHFGAIKYYWTMGYFDVFNANPPLTRMIAGLPYYAYNNTNDFGGSWSDYSSNPADRCEYAIGLNQVLNVPSTDIRVIVFAARVCLIPLIIFGSYIGFKFATELYGFCAGIIFLFLWTASPLVVGWGATLCTDIPQSLAMPI